VIFNKDTRKYKPYAFTEQGVSMLSSVINSKRAIEVNINIMRAFVKLRHYVLSQSKDEQIAELRKLLMVYIENTDYKLSKHDKAIEQIIIALNNLIEKPPKTKTLGFNAGN
jgi:phage regulator Rha-like protein